MSDQKSLCIEQAITVGLYFLWLKASFTIAWGIAPGKDQDKPPWLKAINKSIEYGFQPISDSGPFSWGDAPGYDEIGLQPISKSIEITGT